MDLAQIVNDKNFDRVKRLYDDAIEKGANVEYGGIFDREKLIISPTILTGITHDMLIMEEEIFAPILPVLTYDRLEEITDYLKNKDKPLALYMFSNNEKNIQYILDNTSSGGVCVNDVMMHNAEHNLPFGGVNASGIGNYHGIAGFKTFSHERAVLFNVPSDQERFMNPPYKGKLEMVLNNLK